jgi:hypothetical protein
VSGRDTLRRLREGVLRLASTIDVENGECECANGAKLSFRSGWKNGPKLFVFWPKIVIFEARIIAVPSPSFSKMKYISRSFVTIFHLNPIAQCCD